MTAVRFDLNVDDLIKIYESGKSMKQIADLYGVSQKVIRTRLLPTGCIRKRIIDDLPEDAIVADYVAGKSENNIALDRNVSRNVVRRILLKNGIIIREQIEANRLMMSSRTAEMNAINVAPAHNAVRGRKHSFEHRCKIAKTRELRAIQGSGYEVALGMMISNDFVPQKAIGVYNCDFASNTIAVEVHGGNFHSFGRHAERSIKRINYILDSGLNMVIVWIDKRVHPLTVGCADYITAFSNLASSDPTIRGQYRVIWGDGNDVTAFYPDRNDLTRIPPRGCSK
jgi:Zn-dependent peptidase ImmA (M78 family)